MTFPHTGPGKIVLLFGGPAVKKDAINFTIILLGVAVSIGLRVLAGALLRRNSRGAHQFFSGILVFTHVVYAAAFGWIAAISLGDPTPFRITVAVVLVGLALYECVMAGGMLYVLIAKRAELSD